MIMRGTILRISTAAGLLATLVVAALLFPLLPIWAQDPAVPDAGRGHGGSAQAEQADQAKDIEKLKEEMRQLQEAQQTQLRQIKMIQAHLTFASEVELQNQDYAQARSGFRTKLLRKGPSPQGWSPTKPPPGGTEIEFPSGELRLKAWVNPPTDQTRKYPTVLYLHGGFSFDIGDWNQSKPYRDAGFVVLTPMLRGENGQPGAFTYFYDELDDVLAAADYVSKQPYVDANRLFVAGHSVGGSMTLLAAMASQRFRAAASISGAPYRLDFFTGKNLPFDKSDPRELRLRCPMAYATSFKCPLRIYYGTEEIYFELMSQRTAALAKGRGLDVEAVEIEGNHGTCVPGAINQSMAFFEKNSPPQQELGNGEIAHLPKTLELDLGSGVKMQLVRIEPGKFLMGSPSSEVGRRDDEWQHEVEITKPYCLGVYAVTQAQYRRVMGTKPSFFSPKGNAKDRVTGLNTNDFPVDNVSWEEAMDFCRIVSLQAGVRDKGWVVDLPTEAEWEYACRAGTTTAFHYGDSLSSQQANFNGNNASSSAAKGPFLRRTTMVGTYAANAWGVYDMHGNVLQWCKDWYDKDYYQHSDKRDPVGPMSGQNRVGRGGSWLADAKMCRAAYRDPDGAEVHYPNRGFRVVVRLPGKTS